MTTPAKTALVVVDAQQEYFAPLGRLVLPGGLGRSGGAPISADQVHRTHPGNLDAFLADIRTVDDVAR